MRVEQNKNITSAMAESKNTLQTLREQNSKKQILRDKLQEMQAKHRRMEISIQSGQIENENLKNVQKFEEELRKSRNKKESEILEIASSTQKASMAQATSTIKEFMVQDKKVKEQTDDLKKKMAFRLQNNVQDLLGNIEENMEANRNEIEIKIPQYVKEYEEKYLGMSQANLKLSEQIENLESTFSDTQQKEMDLET